MFGWWFIFIIVQLGLQKPLLLILRYRRPQPKQFILTLICWVQVEVLEVHYHVSSVRSDAVLDSLNPSIRQDDRVLPSDDPPVTGLLLVEVQPVVVRDGVAVPVGAQRRVGGRLSG